MGCDEALFTSLEKILTNLDDFKYIVHHQKGVDLGYDLRPLGEGLAVVQPKRSSRRLRDKPA